MWNPPEDSTPKGKSADEVTIDPVTLEKVKTRLRGWMNATRDMPLDEFIKLFIQRKGKTHGDAGCWKRVQEIAGTCNLLTNEVSLYQAREDKGFVTTVSDQLARKAFKEQVVALKVNGRWGDAVKSRFPPTGFHHLLAIATGGGSGEQFCVVYDPDVSATERSNAEWKACKASDKSTIIERMIVGREGQLGALVRCVREKK